MGLLHSIGGRSLTPKVIKPQPLPHGGVLPFHQKSTSAHARLMWCILGHVAPQNLGSTKPLISIRWKPQILNPHPEASSLCTWGPRKTRFPPTSPQRESKSSCLDFYYTSPDYGHLQHKSEELKNAICPPSRRGLLAMRFGPEIESAVPVILHPIALENRLTAEQNIFQRSLQAEHDIFQDIEPRNPRP